MDHLTDEQFAFQFAEGSLPPELFTHEAHLRLAWVLLRKYDFEKAVTKICDQIARFDRLHGDGTKFHHTLTVAALRIVEHHRLKSAADSFPDFLNEFPRLKTDLKAMIDVHYSSELLKSPDAKVIDLPPDRLPF